MATAANLVTLVVAFLGLGGILLTQYFANHREDVRWSRERDREEAAWAREDAARSNERTQLRLADSYLEVLRIVEREGQWVEASIRNWEIAAEEAKAVPNPDHRPATGFERVKVPEPAVTDRATAGAHLAAFGSDDVRTLYGAWRSTVAEIVMELAVLKAIADDSFPEVPRPQNPTLLPNELRARQALADAVAEELGHR